MNKKKFVLERLGRFVFLVGPATHEPRLTHWEFKGRLPKVLETLPRNVWATSEADAVEKTETLLDRPPEHSPKTTCTVAAGERGSCNRYKGWS